MLRLLTDYGEFQKGDYFIRDSCYIAPGGYEYERLMRVSDRRRLCIRQSRVVELFECAPNFPDFGGESNG